MGVDMTALRLISLPTHAALELAGGLAVMVAPFLFGFTTAGMIVGVALGALIAGLALSTIPVEGRASSPIAAHFAYDRGIAVGLLGGALVLGIAGDTSAALFLAVASLAQAALNLITRYSAHA